MNKRGNAYARDMILEGFDLGSTNSPEVVRLI